MRRLTAKRERFCQEMMTPKANQSDAYRAAFDTRGMKAATVHSEASRLMRDPQITARVAELKALAVKRLQLSREQWLKRLEALVQSDVRKMFAGPGQLIEIHELGDAEAGMIEGYEVVERVQKVGDQAQLVSYSRRVKLIPKLKAILEFGKAMGWYAAEKPQEGPKVIVLRKYVEQAEPFHGDIERPDAGGDCMDNLSRDHYQNENLPTMHLPERANSDSV